MTISLLSTQGSTPYPMRSPASTVPSRLLCNGMVFHELPAAVFMLGLAPLSTWTSLEPALEC